MVKMLVTTHHGHTEEWPARSETEWIKLASIECCQWLIDRGIDAEKMSFDQAMEALTHDYQSVIEIRTFKK